MHYRILKNFDLFNIDDKNQIKSQVKMDEQLLLKRITSDPKIFGGKPIIRGHRLAVEHILGMLAAGDTIDNILEGYPWLENEDIQACLIYARCLVGHERIEVLPSAEVA